MFTSSCPLEVQISQVLGPLFQIEVLKTGRTTADVLHAESQDLLGPIASLGSEG